MLVRGKLEEAGREARVGLQLDPSNANAHYIVGAVRLSLDDPAEALKEARETNRLNPDMGPAYLLKAQALFGIYSNRLSARSVSPPPPPPTVEQREERRRMRVETAAMFREAAESLKTYLKLTPADSSTELWREQLSTIDAYASYDPNSEKGEALFFGDDVTTKAIVLSKPEPAYTAAARNAFVTGRIILRAVFAADGTVRHILVMKALPHGLTENAVNAARKIKFTPAVKDGRPVSMFVQLEYYFDIH